MATGVQPAPLRYQGRLNRRGRARRTWAARLPRGPLPDTGPKDFRKGEVWATYVPPAFCADGEPVCEVFRIDSNPRHGFVETTILASRFGEPYADAGMACDSRVADYAVRLARAGGR